MKKYDKKSAIKIIVHAAKEYEEKLNNKHFLIVYQKKSLTKTVEIGFRNGNRVDYPVTLYNEDGKRLSNPTNKVLAIFSKSYKEKCYNKCTYLSKGQEIGKLKLEEDIRKRIEIVR